MGGTGSKKQNKVPAQDFKRSERAINGSFAQRRSKGWGMKTWAALHEKARNVEEPEITEYTGRKWNPGRGEGMRRT